MRITLDTNAVIALEGSGPEAATLRGLVSLHRAKEITLCVSAIAASERDRNPSGEPNFGKFTARLAALGLENAELLAPLAYWGLAFWDHFVFAELNEPLESAIRVILFPGSGVPASTAPTHGVHEEILGKDRNALCDILGMWCHIKYGGNVFITSDANFHKASKKPRLIALGANEILRPHEALLFIQRNARSTTTGAA